jgi:hypothetical protein
MGQEDKTVLEVEDLEAVTDRGYWDSREILACCPINGINGFDHETEFRRNAESR